MQNVATGGQHLIVQQQTVHSHGLVIPNFFMQTVQMYMAHAPSHFYVPFTVPIVPCNEIVTDRIS